MIFDYKQSARCSFVLEDRSKQAFVWHHDSNQINKQLFDGLGAKIYRWRIGQHDGKQRRFMLVEFANLSQLRMAARGK